MLRSSCDSLNPIYRRLQVYYVCIVADFLLRALWTVNIAVGYFDQFDQAGLVAILAVAEWGRRIMWNFFRLENEHVNNCGEFRAVREYLIV